MRLATRAAGSLQVRRSDERGFADFGWLKSRHTFSFGNYHDPRHMGHGPLRVINEDRVEAARGFAEHSHADMEILSWVLEGSLKHRDSLGTGSTIVPGELQRMSAGTGITHSEMNGSAAQPVHFLQIWIMPAQAGLAPGYEQRRFTDAELADSLRLVASGDTRDGSVKVHQDADLYIGRLAAGVRVTHRFQAGRLGWLQVARGSVALDELALEQGDGIALEGVAGIEIMARTPAEILLFDMVE